MIIKEKVKITPFNLDRMLHIYVPDDYKQTDKKYPVLYMYDGHNLYNDSDATYGHAWRIADTFTKNNIEMIAILNDGRILATDSIKTNIKEVQYEKVCSFPGHAGDFALSVRLCQGRCVESTCQRTAV